MKHIIIALTAILALTLGVTSMAEAPEAAPDTGVPAIEQQAPETEAPEEATSEAEAPAADDNAALTEALQALRDARSSARLDELEAELKGYVEAGKLTQAQADQLMEFYRTHQQNRSQRGRGRDCGDGQNGRMPGGRQSGGQMRGGHGGRGGWMSGNMMPDQAPQTPGE